MFQAGTDQARVKVKFAMRGPKEEGFGENYVGIGDPEWVPLRRVKRYPEWWELEKLKKWEKKKAQQDKANRI